MSDISIKTESEILTEYIHNELNIYEYGDGFRKVVENTLSFQIYRFNIRRIELMDILLELTKRL